MTEKPKITEAAAVAAAVAEGMVDVVAIRDFCFERFRLSLKPSAIARLRQQSSAPAGALSVAELEVAGWALNAFADVERLVLAVREAARLKAAWRNPLPPGSV